MTYLKIVPPFTLLRHIIKSAFTSLPPVISNPQKMDFTSVIMLDVNNVDCTYRGQECTSFIAHIGYEWNIRCHILNVLYYWNCIWCNIGTTYTGNNYVTACRHGGSTDKFDMYVYRRRKKHKNNCEPYAFLTV